MTNEIDEFIVASLGKRWMDIPGIVSRALSAKGLNLPAGYEQMDLVISRVSALVASGVLELEGDLRGTARDEYWRSCRVRAYRRHPSVACPSTVLIPPGQASDSGEVVRVHKKNLKVLYSDEEHVAMEVTGPVDESELLDEGMLILCCWRIDLEATVEFIRELTDEDCRRLRIPRWIQDEEIPKCCHRKMFFVGQLDDHSLAASEPEGADVWWHDYASFYVFTCPKCLKVKAIGQQY